jgi:beta-glucosidase
VAVINPNVVVLIATGSAVIVEDWINNVPGIVQTFYPGQEGGNAVANLLFGDVNFTAKLPFTVARNESDYPVFGNSSDNVNVDFLHGYRKFETEGLNPRFWFGHGLSYTTFEYSELILMCDAISAGGAVNAQVTVTNTGSVAGDEVVMAFVGFPNTAVRRPNKEIKQFRRTGVLAPGESADVTFSIPVRDLSYWSDSGWALEMVEHTLIVAPSADPQDPNKLELPVSFQ